MVMKQGPEIVLLAGLAASFVLTARGLPALPGDYRASAAKSNTGVCFETAASPVPAPLALQGREFAFESVRDEDWPVRPQSPESDSRFMPAPLAILPKGIRTRSDPSQEANPYPA